MLQVSYSNKSNRVLHTGTVFETVNVKTDQLGQPTQINMALQSEAEN